MGSPIDICNMALSDIGARSTIASFDEGSKEAAACAVWYDELRRSLLRGAPWGFARKTAPLSAQPTTQWPWSYMYTYPADCLKARYILPPPPADWDPTQGSVLWPWTGPDRAYRFLIANNFDGTFQRKVLLSNVPDAYLIYTVDVENVELFDPLFKQALAAWLSAKIVLQLTGNVQMRAAFLSTAKDAVDSARAIDGNEALATTDHTPDWIVARGLPAAYQQFGNYNLPGIWYSGFDAIAWGD